MTQNPGQWGQQASPGRSNPPKARADTRRSSSPGQVAIRPAEPGPGGGYPPQQPPGYPPQQPPGA